MKRTPDDWAELWRNTAGLGLRYYMPGKQHLANFAEAVRREALSEAIAIAEDRDFCASYIAELRDET